MPFWLQDHWLIYILRSFSLRKKIILCCLILVVPQVILFLWIKFSSLRQNKKLLVSRSTQERMQKKDKFCVDSGQPSEKRKKISELMLLLTQEKFVVQIIERIFSKKDMEKKWYTVQAVGSFDHLIDVLAESEKNLSSSLRVQSVERIDDTVISVIFLLST